MEQLSGKHVSDSFTRLVQAVMPNHLNGAGRIFGGQLAMWIDMVGGIAARRHCNHNVTTAAIDNLQFRKPVHQNDVIVMHAKVTYVGRTSMEVRVDTFVEDLQGVRTLVNTAYLTEIALDENDRPTPVPPLICDTMQEKAEFEAGKRRRNWRRQQNDYVAEDQQGASAELGEKKI